MDQDINYWLEKKEEVLSIIDELLEAKKIEKKEAIKKARSIMRQFNISVQELEA